MSQSPYRTPSTTLGLCECGCGRATKIATRNDVLDGRVKGQPVRFIQGHSGGLQKRKEDRYVVDESTGCWLWKSPLTKAGYGQYIDDNGKVVYAHRWMYEKHKGTIPVGLVLDHKITCPKRCINPDHLEPVTDQVNLQRGKHIKLSPKIVIDIRTSELSARELAEKHQIQKRQVYYVRSGKTWNNIQSEVTYV